MKYLLTASSNSCLLHGSLNRQVHAVLNINLLLTSPSVGKWDSSISGASAITKLKRVWDKKAPCGTPLGLCLGEEVFFVTLDCMCALIGHVQLTISDVLEKTRKHCRKHKPTPRFENVTGQRYNEKGERERYFKRFIY